MKNIILTSLLSSLLFFAFGHTQEVVIKKEGFYKDISLVKEVDNTDLNNSKNIASYLEVTPSNRNVPYTPGNTSFSISSNTTWLLSDDATWLNINISSGSDDQLIITNFGMNYGEERVAHITVEGDGVASVTVTVTQAASPPPFLEVEPPHRDVYNGPETVNFTISSNVGWTITDNADWVTIYPESGNNNGTFQASYENNTGDPRTAEIYITGENNLSRTVTLYQAYNPNSPPPRNLAVDELGNAIWDAPELSVELPMWLTYVDDNIVQSIGTIGGGSIEAAVKWDPLQLVGFEGTSITQIRFFLAYYYPLTIKVLVYQGDEGVLIHEQSLSNPIYGDWNTLVLNEPIEIDIDQSIWVAYRVSHIANQYPAGVCASVDNSNSDLVRNNDGPWLHLQPNLNYSWNLSAYVEGEDGKTVKLPDSNVLPSQKESINKNPALFTSDPNKIDYPEFDDPNKELYAYWLYLDEEEVGQSSIKEWSFIDLIPGEDYLAGVSAFFSSGESQIIHQEFTYLPPPSDFTVTPEGLADWSYPTKNKSTVFLSENFNNGLASEWTIIDGGSNEFSWGVVTDFQDLTFDGTPFMMANSDAAGDGSFMDELLISPVINVTDVTNLLLEWDQNFYEWAGAEDFISLEVFDGSNWIEVFMQINNDPTWPEYSHQTIDLSAYVNSQIQFRFRYYSNLWAWWAAIDNIVLYEPEEYTYKVYLDDEYLNNTDAFFWQYENLNEGQFYTAGVSVDYGAGESGIAEYEFLYHENYYYLGVSPPNQEVPYLSGSISFNVTSNDNWQVSTSASWIHVVNSSGSGDGYFQLEYEINDGDARVGVIRVESNNGQIVEVTISQDGIEDFLPPRNLRVTSYGMAVWDPPFGDLSDLVGYNVYLDGEAYTATIEEFRQFLSLIPNQEYIAGVQAVYSDQNLSAIIEADFHYTSVPDIIVSPEIQTVSYGVGSITYKVYSNTDWSVSSSNSWVNISPSSGINDGEFIVYYLENNSYQRTAQMFISADHLQDLMVSLIQQGPNTLSTQIAMLPSFQDVDDDEVFSTHVKITDVEQLSDFEFEVLFNPSILKIESSNITPFITSTGRLISTQINEINNDYGFLEIAVTTIGDGIDGPSGDGVLLEIDWSVTESVFNQTTTGLLLKDILLINSNNQEINHLSTDASVSINPTGIEEFYSGLSFNIIPNPNRGIFILSGQSDYHEVDIVIYDFAGRQILEDKMIKQSANKMEKKFDLSEFESGVYLMKIKHREQISYEKFVIY